MGTKRINISLPEATYNDLRALNKAINNDNIKIGTFGKIILDDFIREKREKYYVSRGKIIAKQEDMFSGVRGDRFKKLQSR